MAGVAQTTDCEGSALDGSEETSLRQSTVSGVKWSSIAQFGRQGMQVLTTIVLARLLSPSDFGLASMAMVVIGFLGMFKDLGTCTAVIQRKELSGRLLSSVYWVNVIFGILATGVLFALAPLAADFYREARVTPLLRALSLTFAISGASILHQAILTRDLRFQTLAKLESSAAVFGSVVGVVSAFMGAGVWSMIYQSLAVTVLTTMLLWASSEWRPQIALSWSEVKSVGSYGLHLTGFNIFNYFARNADYLLIGRFLGAQELGYYTLAYRIMLYPLQSVSAVIGRVMFPVFSRIQEDDDRLGRAYHKVVASIALVTFPLMLGLLAVSGPFVSAVFGAKWSHITLLVVILAPVGMVQSIMTTVGTIYQAKGRTDLFFLWGVVGGSLIVLSFVVGLRWGIIGVAAGYAVINAILVYPSFAVPMGMIGLRAHSLGKVLWQPMLAGMLMALCVLGIRSVLPAALDVRLTLGILVAIGCIIYWAASWLLNRGHIQELVSLMRAQWQGDSKYAGPNQEKQAS